MTATSFSRVLEITGSRNLHELSGNLSVTLAEASDAQRRNTIPPEWVRLISQKYGANPDWIITGNGSRHSAG